MTVITIVEEVRERKRLKFNPRLIGSVFLIKLDLMCKSSNTIFRREVYMVRWHLGKHKRLVIAVAATAVVVVLALVGYQELVLKHMYPQHTFLESPSSNLSVRGIVTSIEENRKSQGISDYHIFRFYIRLNITEVVWVKEDMTDWYTPFINGTLHTLGVGYDNLDNPQLVIGQTVECKGYYDPVLDSPYSHIMTVSPNISESYLKPQV